MVNIYVTNMKDEILFKFVDRMKCFFSIKLLKIPSIIYNMNKYKILSRKYKANINIGKIIMHYHIKKILSLPLDKEVHLIRNSKQIIIEDNKYSVDNKEILFTTCENIVTDKVSIITLM